jgi:hypothetical protein
MSPGATCSGRRTDRWRRRIGQRLNRNIACDDMAEGPVGDSACVGDCDRFEVEQREGRNAEHGERDEHFEQGKSRFIGRATSHQH